MANRKYDVAAYIWPAYTGDDMRTRIFWPEGMGEWQSVRSAERKYEGHDWPRRPLWGYVNEADPFVMQMEIEAAVAHGVNVFVYDWYWYDKRPFLEKCLDNGFLKAANRDKMKFYIMWANHDAGVTWDKRLAGTEAEQGSEGMVWTGRVGLDEFRKLIPRWIEKYFKEPNYYQIDGKPVFMIYDAMNFVKDMGTVEAARAALDEFRAAVEAAGFPGLHLQMVISWEGSMNLSGFDPGHEGGGCRECAERLGFDSVTHYQFAHYINPDQDYLDILDEAKAEWERIDREYPMPYFPGVSVGWDNNPRYTTFRHGVVKNATPENIKKGMQLAKDYLDAHPEQPPLVTINSWNEWTETSYLQPDDLYGYGYLEAVRDVFKGE